ncbi:hypothetical protein RIEGSTA812A_PEG_372 [invertebrate metagenome]|uniref:Uncharacterized protein n=1 Tax=invertebrate metagenome TaxID=1711999 RepID=A0A484H4X6_9ZZZZ
MRRERAHSVWAAEEQRATDRVRVEDALRAPCKGRAQRTRAAEYCMRAQRGANVGQYQEHVNYCD